MRVRVERVRDQISVIIDGSSGIGFATARLAARGGARLPLTSRDAVIPAGVFGDAN